MLKSLKGTIARHPLRSPAFLRLWLGLSISYVGDQLTTIALLWFVLQLTGSGIAISLVLLCFQLPSMITGPLLGVILDRRPPRWVIGIDNCARALLIGAMPVLFWAGMLRLWQICVLALGACSWAPYVPIEPSLSQRLIEPSLHGQVFGVRLALTTAAAPLGAVVGGLLLQYLAPDVVIGLSGIACILAGVGALLSPTMRSLDGKTTSVTR